MGKIFISYARADDEPFVKQLYQDLTKPENGFDIWWDKKSMESRGLTFLQEIRDAIEGSDRLIAVIGPNAVKSEYVKVEWEHALLFSKGVVPILRMGLGLTGKNDYDLVPPELSKFHCPDFRKERSYQDALAELVRVLAEPVPPLGAHRTAVPSLPPHFLPRRIELDLLGNAVLADIKRPEVVNSAKQKTVIVGMGGMGKSVLAAAFARSTETRRAFTDGVIWISIGQNPDMLPNLRQLGLAFNDKLENYVDLKIARDKLPGVLADKVCLIVLDDIWNVAHAEPFINALGPRCRLLITTRDGGIASALEANEHRLGVLTEAAALRFLASWCGKEVDSLPQEAVSVAKKCGNLPFALALCGAMARDGTSWPDMLDALKEADLTFMEKKFPNYPYTDVLKSLKISVDAMANENPEAVRHYQRLVVFHSHKKIPEAAILTLWMHMDELKERNARKTLTTLNSKALLTLEGESPHRFATLHDLQHDYLRAAFEGDQKKLHVELLEAYREKCKDGWHGGPNDGYFFENLPYHLVEAGRKDELRGLLFDFAWLHAKIDAVDVNALIRDYDFISGDRTSNLVQNAIRLSAHILTDREQLQSQLTGRLLSFQEPEIKSLLEGICECNHGIWLRPLTASLTQPGGPLMRTLKGHTDWANGVSLTPDGKRAISASSDKTIIVWDMESWSEIRKLKGHTDVVSAVSVTPDGRCAISASFDKTLKVWDIESGGEIRTLKGHAGSVRAVSVTPDGKRAISASDDHTLKVWDMESGIEIRTLEGHIYPVWAVSVTPDGRRIISAANDNTLKVWDMENGIEIRTLKGHAGGVRAVSVTPDGRKAISASSDSMLKIWDMESGFEIRTLKGHTSIVYAVSVTPDGKQAISASFDHTLKVWDMESGVEIRTLKGHNGPVNTVSVTLDGRRAISGSTDFTLKVWGMDNGVEIRKLKGHTDTVLAVSVTSDGRRAISASSDNTLKIWDMESGVEIRTLRGYTDAFSAVFVTPDGRRAISASCDLALKVWDMESGCEIRTLRGHHTRWVNTVSVTLDGRLIISGSSDGTLKVWNMETGVEIRTLRGHTGGVFAASVTPDGRRIISGSSDGTLKVWDIDTGVKIRTLKGHTEMVSAVSVTLDGRHAISGSSDNTLKVWDLETGVEIRTFKGHTAGVNAVSVTLDGRRAISASDDFTLKIWDMEGGKIIAGFCGEDTLDSCAISPDGKTIVVGEASGRVHFLRLEGK